MKSLIKNMFIEFKNSQKKRTQTIIEKSKSHAALMEQ
jgi:hypothetical protein